LYLLKTFEKLLLTDPIKRIIMDYVKTRELYQELGQIKKFEETPDFNRYKKEQKWNEKVKSKRTGEYH
jgi:hypothetical protein